MMRWMALEAFFLLGAWLPDLDLDTTRAGQNRPWKTGGGDFWGPPEDDLLSVG